MTYLLTGRDGRLQFTSGSYPPSACALVGSGVGRALIQQGNLTGNVFLIGGSGAYIQQGTSSSPGYILGGTGRIVINQSYPYTIIPGTTLLPGPIWAEFQYSGVQTYYKTFTYDITATETIQNLTTKIAFGASLYCSETIQKTIDNISLSSLTVVESIYKCSLLYKNYAATIIETVQNAVTKSPTLYSITSAEIAFKSISKSTLNCSASITGSIQKAINSTQLNVLTVVNIIQKAITTFLNNTLLCQISLSKQSQLIRTLSLTAVNALSLQASYLLSLLYSLTGLSALTKAPGLIRTHTISIVDILQKQINTFKMLYTVLDSTAQKSINKPIAAPIVVSAGILKQAKKYANYVVNINASLASNIQRLKAILLSVNTSYSVSKALDKTLPTAINILNSLGKHASLLHQYVTLLVEVLTQQVNSGGGQVYNLTLNYMIIATTQLQKQTEVLKNLVFYSVAKTIKSIHIINDFSLGTVSTLQQVIKRYVINIVVPSKEIIRKRVMLIKEHTIIQIIKGFSKRKYRP